VADGTFNEKTLYAEIVSRWGRWGAHADVFRTMLAEIQWLREVAEAADYYHDVACDLDRCQLCRTLQVWQEARRG